MPCRFLKPKSPQQGIASLPKSGAPPAPPTAPAAPRPSSSSRDAAQHVGAAEGLTQDFGPQLEEGAAGEEVDDIELDLSDDDGGALPGTRNAPAPPCSFISFVPVIHVYATEIVQAETAVLCMLMGMASMWAIHSGILSTLHLSFVIQFPILLSRAKRKVLKVTCMAFGNTGPPERLETKAGPSGRPVASPEPGNLGQGDVDPEVLAMLPADIQKEVWASMTAAR